MSFYGSVIDMLERFATQEIKDKYIQVIAGNISGSMCLAEPDCGSDLGALKTSAKLQRTVPIYLMGLKYLSQMVAVVLALVLADTRTLQKDYLALVCFFVIKMKKTHAKMA